MAGTQYLTSIINLANAFTRYYNAQTLMEERGIPFNISKQATELVNSFTVVMNIYNKTLLEDGDKIASVIENAAIRTDAVGSINVQMVMRYVRAVVAAGKISIHQCPNVEKIHCASESANALFREEFWDETLTKCPFNKLSTPEYTMFKAVLIYFNILSYKFGAETYKHLMAIAGNIGYRAQLLNACSDKKSV